MIYVNGNELTKGKFPNNETWIDKKFIQTDGYATVKITFKYESDEDLIHLGMVKSYLDNNCLKPSVYLTIAYMPYSRMDRQNDDYIFSLKYVCEFINNLKFTKVNVFEPHSDVTTALLDRCFIIPKTDMMFVYNKAISDNTDIVYYPDAGAQKRYDFKLPYLVGNKKRDFNTGNITGIDIQGDENVNNKTVTIVDDLCSKGGSFYYPAKILKERGAKKIILVVTHCEDNIFNGELLDTDYIDEIYTTNSILTKQHKKIKVENVI